MKRLAALLIIVAGGGLWGSCATLNPERACEEPTVEQRCPPEYACIQKSRFPWEGQVEVCVPIGAKTIGEPCTVPEECEGFEQNTATCGDSARTCPNPDDPRCDFRCRRACSDHGQCPGNQICWPQETSVNGFCQEGECGESNQGACPSGLECAWFKSGDTGGICFPPCDVLRQNDCNNNPPPQDALCCAPQEACVHFASRPTSASCLSKGTGGINDLCATNEANNRPSCNEGLFCSDQLPCPTGGCEFRCLQYCNRGAGGPVCNELGAICKEIPAGSQASYGYCD